MHLTWLADVLKAAGLKIIEQPGWKTRGHEIGAIQGLLCHHTAGAKHGNMPSLSIITHGRADLSGPLAQLGLGRDGTFYIVAAGKANHAGRGRWHGITSGNMHMIGIEAENTGYVHGPRAEPWPEVQMKAYQKGVAAIFNHLSLDPIMCAGHKEYALPKGRKTDPTFDMDEFRDAVEGLMTVEVAKKGLIEEPLELKPEEVVAVDPNLEGLEPNVMFEPVPVTKPVVKHTPKEVVLPAPGTPTAKVVTHPKSDIKPKLPTPPHPEAQVVISQPTVPPPAPPETPRPTLDMSGVNRPKWVVDYLENLGWSESQAVAITATWMSQIGEKLDTHNILPWRDKALDKITWYSKYLGTQENFWRPVTDIELQTRYIDWELNHTEKTAGRAIKQSTELLDALRAATGYIRSPGWDPSHPEDRVTWPIKLRYAHEIFPT